jgi:serine/threonine-protein kinase RsbW/stage II sporulation protein AB (anti-sigma F factor)
MARRALQAFLVARGVDPQAFSDALLAVSEVVTNAVVHGYREATGEVTLEADHRGDTLRLSVADAGAGMSPRPDSPGLGLGLPLVSRVAEQVEIEAPDGGGTHVTMRFTLNHRRKV